MRGSLFSVFKQGYKFAIKIAVIALAVVSDALMDAVNNVRQ